MPSTALSKLQSRWFYNMYNDIQTCKLFELDYQCVNDDLISLYYLCSLGNSVINLNHARVCSCSQPTLTNKGNVSSLRTQRTPLMELKLTSQFCMHSPVTSQANSAPRQDLNDGYRFTYTKLILTHNLKLEFYIKSFINIQLNFRFQVSLLFV